MEVGADSVEGEGNPRLPERVRPRAPRVSPGPMRPLALPDLLPLLAVPLLPACDAGEDACDDTGCADTADAGDPDSGDPDSGDPDSGDTGDTAVAEDELRFVAIDAAALEGTTLALYATDAFFESLDVSTPLVGVPFDGTAFAVTWTPAADDLVDDPAYGGRAGKFAALVFTDADGDAAWDAGEELVGMPTYQIWYLADAPTDAHAALGMGQGMNAMDLHATDVSGAPVLADPLAIPVDANLRERATVTLSGTASRPFAADERLVTFFSSEAGDVLVDGGPAVDPWTFAFDGPPDPAAFSTSIPGVDLATGYPIVFADSDGSGTWDAGEPMTMYPATDGGYEATVAWVGGVEDPDLAYRLLVRLGLTRFGWAAYRLGEGGYTQIEDARLGDLVMVGF